MRRRFCNLREPIGVYQALWNGIAHLPVLHRMRDLFLYPSHPFWVLSEAVFPMQAHPWADACARRFGVLVLPRTFRIHIACAHELVALAEGRMRLIVSEADLHTHHACDKNIIYYNNTTARADKFLITWLDVERAPDVHTSGYFQYLCYLWTSRKSFTSLFTVGEHVHCFYCWN